MAESGTAHDDEVAAIVRGTRFLLRKYQEREHILSAVLRGIDHYEALIAIMRSSESAEVGTQRAAEMFEIDEVQARAVMDIQARSLSQPHHQRMVAEHDRMVEEIADLEAILASPDRLRELAGTERGAYLARQNSG